jgi:hypothetical protein
MSLLRHSSTMSDSTDEHPARRYPIIVITGTPGTGKSTHAELVVAQSSAPLRHVNVGELVKAKGLHEGFDDEWESYIVDEDKVRAARGPGTGTECVAGDRRDRADDRRRGVDPRLAHLRRVSGAVGRPCGRFAVRP